MKWVLIIIIFAMYDYPVATSTAEFQDKQHCTDAANEVRARVAPHHHGDATVEAICRETGKL